MTDDLLGLAVALGIGLLLGVERERHKGTGASRAPAGVRTFALVGLIGGLSMLVGGLAVAAVALGIVGLAAFAGYVTSRDDDPGMTTEFALVADLLLGALAQKEPGLAAGAGVAVAILLAGRQRLHRLVRDTLSERELHDALLFAACALIVLPLIPDEGIGPNEAFNPAAVWRLVVIVMAVQGAGYIALRAIGPRYGLLVSGFIGGFVSSTATVATMGALARRQPELRRAAGSAGVVSSVATIVLLAIVIAAASTETLRDLWLALLLAGIAAAAYAGLVAIHAAGHAPRELPKGRAFDLRVALVLAATVSAVLVVSGALNEALGRSGLILGTGVAGFADSQSAAISAAALAAAGQVTTANASIAVLTALTTNSVSKAVLAALTGRRRYALDVWPGLAAMVLAAWGGWALTAAI